MKVFLTIVSMIYFTFIANLGVASQLKNLYKVETNRVQISVIILHLTATILAIVLSLQMW